ncbi:MAG: hypothetical protein ABI318_06955 [Chthoniobacteraceae bacterium]
MADETPTSSPNPNDESDMKETIRITLPPTTEGPAAKRETVRINIPEHGGTVAPKKETSKVSVPLSGVGPPPITRPSAPPAPPPLSKPVSGLTPPPKPPPFASKPTVPLRPSPSGAVPAPPSGIVAKPASPKKETARISLPTDAPKSSAPALPKATVKMQATQPLMKTQPPQASGIQQQTSGIRTTGTPTNVAPAISAAPAKSDTPGLVLGILACAAAIAAGVFAFLVWKAAELPAWVQ